VLRRLAAGADVFITTFHPRCAGGSALPMKN